MWKAKDLTEGIPRAVSSDLRLLRLDIETGEKPAENRRASEQGLRHLGIAARVSARARQGQNEERERRTDADGQHSSGI